MQKTLGISVAICTYNGEPFLAEQLKSILTQSRLPDELLVCDDGSVDDTLAVLSQFAATAPFPVRIVKNTSRLGSTANFSKAIALCNGDIVVLSDQDDVWHMEKLACLASAFDSSPDVAGFFSDGELIDMCGHKISGTLWRRVGFLGEKKNAMRSSGGFDILMRSNVVTGATMAFRSQYKSLLLPVPNGWVHDHWLAVLLSAVSRLDFIEARLIQYRCHAAQQLGVNRDFREMLKIFFAHDNAAYLLAAERWKEFSLRLRESRSEFDVALLNKCDAIAGHMERRGTLSRRRLYRLPAVFAETVNGNYFRYSLGIRSILHDVFSH